MSWYNEKQYMICVASGTMQAEGCGKFHLIKQVCQSHVSVIFEMRKYGTSPFRSYLE
jgi:hypothetical protein